MKNAALLSLLFVAAFFSRAQAFDANSVRAAAAFSAGRGDVVSRDPARADAARTRSTRAAPTRNIPRYLVSPRWGARPTADFEFDSSKARYGAACSGLFQDS